MKISDLINIGRLKFSLKGGRPFIKVKAEYQHLLPRLNNVFLIFKDHRVRYGKIDILKIIGENKAVINVDDDDLLDELSAEESVNIALDEDEINSVDEESIYYDPIGMKVIWNDEEVAVIKDFFHNGAHYVYEIVLCDQTPDTTREKERVVLIPDVESFVIETNVEERFIRVVNLDQFIAIDM